MACVDSSSYAGATAATTAACLGLGGDRFIDPEKIRIKMASSSGSWHLSLLKTPDVKSSAIGMPSSSGRVPAANATPSVTQGDVIIAEALVAQAEAT